MWRELILILRTIPKCQRQFYLKNVVREELRMKSDLKNTLRKLLLWQCCISFSVLGLSCDRKEHPYKLLPSTAKQIHEYNWQSSFPPDYCYFLKAEIPESDFLVYKNRMGFVEYKDDITKVDWSGFEGVGVWWNPSDNNDIIYYDPTMKGSGKAYMKYENGSLFYKESAGI